MQDQRLEEGAQRAEAYEREKQQEVLTPEEQAAWDAARVNEPDDLVGLGASSLEPNIFRTPQEEEERDQHVAESYEATYGYDRQAEQAIDRHEGGGLSATNATLNEESSERHRNEPESPAQAQQESDIQKRENLLERQADASEDDLSRDPDRPPTVPS